MRSDRMTVTVETALDRALGRIPDVVFERSGRRWTHAFSADVWWRLTVERDEAWSSTRGLVHVGVVVPAAIELLQGTDVFPVKVSPGNVSEYLCLLMGQRRLQPFDTLHPGGQDRRGWFSRRVSPTSADPVEVLESHLSRFALPWLRAHSDLSVIASTRQRVLGDSPAGYLRAEVAVYTWMANRHDSAMALLDENDRRNQDDRKVLELDKRLRVELPQIGSEADGEASTG